MEKITRHEDEEQLLNDIRLKQIKLKVRYYYDINCISKR